MLSFITNILHQCPTEEILEFYKSNIIMLIRTKSYGALMYKYWNGTRVLFIIKPLLLLFIPYVKKSFRMSLRKNKLNKKNNI